MFNRILVVCAGNICRSPLGEVLLKQSLSDKQVTSAGLVARNGDGAAQYSVELAEENGLDLTQHAARKLTRELCAANDLILVMEPQHQRDVAAKFPEASGKTLLLGKWINVETIPDPHKQSKEAFNHAFELIKKSCDAWAEKLGKKNRYLKV
ncbi:MAG: low molecular weight phosphotyrosine protein phosphatase [Gammaproteobacteria bacterium]|nr:low molecular weight phosphotyrosine protein phosphatase [Gammaproteobacteria bacterium]